MSATIYHNTCQFCGHKFDASIEILKCVNCVTQDLKELIYQNVNVYELVKCTHKTIVTRTISQSFNCETTADFCAACNEQVSTEKTDCR